ncbi:MAG: Hsp20/alpha crystallin family protein [Deltaproteobacteria bacterium]|nr:Hsp20/alpha crystallin family protein [Deltaproteobacteria bacterium]
MEERMKVSPDVCSWVDTEHTKLFIEAVIPGVKKEDIHLKMHEDSMYLDAPRDEIEYTSTMAFCCPVNDKAAKAHYENGLLRIEVPFKDPMEDATSVSIN